MESGAGATMEPDQPPSEPAREMPNVVFVLYDDLGIGDVSAYNQTKSAVTTPTIDTLAATGMRFTNGHTSTGICSPTRYGVQTGDHPWHVGKAGTFEHNYSQAWFPEGQRTIADLAQEAGYHTGYVGKWHIGYQVYHADGSLLTGDSSNQSLQPDWSKGITDHPYDHGYAYAFGHTSSADIPPYKYFENDQWVTREAVWITKALALSSGIADEPADGTNISTLRDGWMDPDWDFNQIQRRLTDKAVAYVREQAQDKSKPFFLFFAPSAPHTPNVPSPDFQGKTPHNYTDYILECDAMLGEVVAQLKAQGVYDNTIIVVTSDNGANRSNANFADHQGSGMWGNTEIAGQKADAWEGGHRVPLVMHWGDDTAAGSAIQPGTVTNELVSLQDYFRSFARLWEVDIAPDEGVDSWNILPVWFGDGTLQRLREANFANSHGEAYTITKQYPDGNEWKLIYSSGSGNGFSSPKGTTVDHTQPWGSIDLSNLQLYRLDSDIGESDNLASSISAEASTRAQELHALLNDYFDNATSNATDPDASQGLNAGQ